MARHIAVKSVLLTSLSALALTACSGGEMRQAKSEAPMPPITEMDAAMNAPAPQPLADADTLTPVMPKADASTEQRLAALEQSVESLRADFDRIEPAFASLNTTNERIQKLLGEAERETAALKAETVPQPTITPAPVMASAPPVTASTDVPVTGTIPAPGTVSRQDGVVVTPRTEGETTEAYAVAPVVTAPAAGFKTTPTVEEARAEAARQTGATTVVAASTPASSGETGVKGVRIGEHGTKTRIVLDLVGTAKPAYKYDIDNTEKLLIVDLAGTRWNGAATGTPKSPLIESWAAQETPSGGSAVAVQLKKGARVVSSEYLKPEGANPGRIVLDIAAEG